jgi:hypothetical protein
VVIERHGRAVDVVVSNEEYDELNDITLQQLRAEINLGLADLERGACTDYAADDLPKLAARIKATGRERLAKKRSIGFRPGRKRISLDADPPSSPKAAASSQPL